MHCLNECKLSNVYQWVVGDSVDVQVGEHKQRRGCASRTEVAASLGRGEDDLKVGCMLDFNSIIV